MPSSGIYMIMIGPYYYYGLSHDLRKRRREHFAELRYGYHHNEILQRAYNKYGQYSFGVVEYIAEDHLAKTEAKLISEHISKPYCANLREEDGTGSFRHTQATKEKMSKALKGRLHSEETKQKISKANTGKVRSEEAKKRMSESSKMRSHSIETRQKMSAILKGRKFTEEHKKAVSNGVRKNLDKIVVLEPDGTKRTFETSLEAADYYGHSPVTIRYWARNRQSPSRVPKFKGYLFFRESPT